MCEGSEARGLGTLGRLVSRSSELGGNLREFEGISNALLRGLAFILKAVGSQ